MSQWKIFGLGENVWVGSDILGQGQSFGSGAKFSVGDKLLGLG